ncbi:MULTISPECIES: DUF4910 domain-containing protein [Mesotoga]|uniref:Putative aminopeptidase n=2 Tax=Mesotoga prima TaxID=1184387 RepID=I2F6Z5_9BACT|nr:MULTISPECIES: DUF4910 domain-containing protein [Mesotoga]CCU84396.1 Peptidase M28 [Mesotoga infera]AFK07698.1 putative aminopeptidase [Mesotoga prima MesG1.Ag.4.2]HNQ70672.1 DUF4910 domain-containing protein [Mesotoga prima]HNS75723.1 DUF4910 domain-containing protein [Mesotoga prima]HOP37478.1 DUF4910 domain-containing protein [Mesotoga prima]
MSQRLDGKKVKSLIEMLSGYHRMRGSRDYKESMNSITDYLIRSGLPENRFRVLKYPADGVTKTGNIVSTLAWEPVYGELWLENPERVFVTSTKVTKVSLVSGSGSSKGWESLPLVVYDGKGDYSGKAVLASEDPVKVFQHAVVEGGARCLILCHMRKVFEEIGRSLNDLPQMTNFLTIPHDRDSADRNAVAFSVTKEKYDLLFNYSKKGSAIVGFRAETNMSKGSFDVLQIDATGFNDGPQVLITAHLCHPSPGADDNGSGAALAVEIARVLNDENFPYSVKIALVPEYLGSVPYALQLKSENNLPIYTINLDMVGADQNKTGSTFILSKVPPYLPQRWGNILEFYIKTLMPSNAGYPLKRFGEIPFMAGSDHCVFTTLGIPSPFMGHLPDRYYHSDLDTPQMMDEKELEWVGLSALNTLDQLVKPDQDLLISVRSKMIGELFGILNRISGREGSDDVFDLLISNYEGEVLRKVFNNSGNLPSLSPLEPTFDSSLGLEWIRTFPQELKDELEIDFASIADFVVGGAAVVGGREAVELLASIHYGVEIGKVRVLTGWMIEKGLLRS